MFKKQSLQNPVPQVSKFSTLLQKFLRSLYRLKMFKNRGIKIQYLSCQNSVTCSKNFCEAQNVQKTEASKSSTLGVKIFPPEVSKISTLHQKLLRSLYRLKIFKKQRRKNLPPEVSKFSTLHQKLLRSLYRLKMFKKQRRQNPVPQVSKFSTLHQKLLRSLYVELHRKLT